MGSMMVTKRTPPMDDTPTPLTGGSMTKRSTLELAVLEGATPGSRSRRLRLLPTSSGVRFPSLPLLVVDLLGWLAFSY